MHSFRIPTVRSSRQAPWWLPRIFHGLLILFLVSVLVFAATQALPGDVARVILGDTATPEQLAILREKLGLDRPVHVQYLDWLVGIFRGDLGVSLITGRPVTEMLGERARNTLILAVVALLVMLPLALITGMLAALRRGRFTDKLILGLSVVINAIPEFVLGTMLIALLATTVFQVLPAVSIIPPGSLPTWYPEMLVLPVATLTVFGGFYLARLVRASFIDALDSEYIQHARLRGISESRILWVHTLPNALAPVVPAASLVAALMIGGTVVVEYLFAYPGVGMSLVEAVGNRDVPIIQAVILMIASAYFLLNFVADLFAREPSTQ